MPKSVGREVVEICAYNLRWVVLFSALINITLLAPTIYMLQVYDRVMSSNSIETLLFLSLALAGALGVQAVLEQLRQRLLLSASQTLDRVFGVRLLNRLLSARLSQDQPQLSKALRDLDAIRSAATGPGVVAIIDLPWAVIYIGVAFLIHWSLGMIAFGSATVLLMLAALNERIGRSYYLTASDAVGASMSLQESVSGQAGVIRALGMTRNFVALVDRRRQEANLPQYTAQKALSTISGLTKFIRLLLQSLALGVGAVLAIEKLISPGEVFACSMIISRSLAPMDQLVANWRGLQRAGTSYAELRQLLLPLAQEDRTGLPAPRPKISIENGSLTLAGRVEPILRHISISLSGGSIVALVGPSGAGKTSLLKVLTGSVALTEGEVKIDGARLDDWDPDRLGRFIGYCPQETALFPGTVRDNISRFDSRQHANAADLDAAVIAAANLSGAHQMILTLPNGYDTWLGPGGQGLSAGQRQRVAFARALYGSPPILILDEPNAGLDDTGERVLIDVLSELRRNGTLVLVAAHSPRIITVADKVALLVNGSLDRFGDTKDIVAVTNRPVLREGGLAGAGNG